jgi:four helix bundle protein
VVKIKRFEDIEAWQLARELARKVYRLTKKPRFTKDFGLKSQIQDAAGSSMHNIAEGFDSETNAEFIRFLRYAKRSCTDVKYRVNFISLLMKSTFLSTNLKMSMSKPEEPVLQSTDSSSISENMKTVKKLTVNGER